MTMRHAVRRPEAVGCVLLGLSLWAVPAGAQKNTPPRAELWPGVRQVDFTTPHGVVSTRFPDDMSAGDTISGTVVGDPAGTTEAERERSRGELRGYVVEIEPEMDERNGRSPVARLELAASAFSLVLPRPATAARRLTGTCRVLLKDARGKVLGRTEVPVHAPALTPPAGSAYRLPAAGQEGRYGVISGPFDGEVTTTSLDVGGRAAKMVAESPRQTVFETPLGSKGLTELVLQEKGVRTSGPYRCVTVKLTAPRTTLLRGEQTVLGIEVGGLESLRETIPLQVEVSGVVSAEGGASQTIPIQPKDVGADGTCRHTRTLTGQRAGSFAVTATVLLPCQLVGETVEVVRNLGGTTGLWNLEVKLPDGRVIRLRLETKDRPTVAPGDRIRITKCYADKWGEPWVEGFEEVGPPPPPAPPGAAAPPAPPAPAAPPDTTAPTSPPTLPPLEPPPPCKTGDERNRSETQRNDFDYLTAENQVTLQVRTDVDAGRKAARDLAAFWGQAATVGDLLAKLLPGGVGKSVAGALLGYLEHGETILRAVADGPQMPGWVTVVVTITTTRTTVEHYTVEVCRGGVWVTERRCRDTTSAGPVIHEFEKLTQGSDAWEREVQHVQEQRRLDPSKVDRWAARFLAQYLRRLHNAEADLANFKAGCHN